MLASRCFGVNNQPCRCITSRIDRGAEDMYVAGGRKIWAFGLLHRLFSTIWSHCTSRLVTVTTIAICTSTRGAVTCDRCNLSCRYSSTVARAKQQNICALVGRDSTLEQQERIAVLEGALFGRALKTSNFGKIDLLNSTPGYCLNAVQDRHEAESAGGGPNRDSSVAAAHFKPGMSASLLAS